MRWSADPSDRPCVIGVVNHLVITVLASVLAITGTLLLVNASAGPQPTLDLSPMLGGTLFLFASVLAARSLPKVFAPGVSFAAAGPNEVGATASGRTRIVGSMTRADFTPIGQRTEPISVLEPAGRPGARAPAPRHLQGVLDRFRKTLSGVERLGVAFSGGVDSSVLLALAVRELGTERVLAVTGVSPSLAARDRARARGVAEHLGARLLEVTTHEIDSADYRRNGPDRCFFCKDELFSVITDELVAEHGLDAVAYGENADDALRPDRPGASAATAHRVLRPLADAGVDKATVREIGRWLDVPTADTPASPCLASRIPHHSEVTAAKLAQVEKAEDAVLALGVAQVRVRHHSDIARIEVLPEDLPTVLAARTRLVADLRGVGFRHVTVDLAGLQSGLFTLEALGLRNTGA